MVKLFMIFRSAKFDCSAAKDNVKTNYNELTKLPIDSMLGKLYAKGVITLDEKQRMEVKPLQRNKMVYLLDNVITPSLGNDVSKKFKGFIEVMEESDDPILTDMANILGMYVSNQFK